VSALSLHIESTDCMIQKALLLLLTIVIRVSYRIFFLGREHLCVGKLISCGHRLQRPRGSGGMVPQKNFEILSPLRVI